MVASTSVYSTAPKIVEKTSILPILIKAFGPAFAVGSVFKLIDDLMIFLSPQILRLIIQFVVTSTSTPTVENAFRNESTTFAEVPKIPEQEPLWHGVFFSVALFAVAVVKTLLKTHHFHCMSIVGQRVRTALVGAVYRKSLVLSNSARREFTVGEIVNLMAIDAERFKDLTDYLNMLWSAPLQVGLALYFLWSLLGPSVLAGK